MTGATGATGANGLHSATGANILQVLPGSAAGKRGLQKGMLLISVDDTSTAGLPLQQVQRMVAGADRPVRLHFAGAQLHNADA